MNDNVSKIKERLDVVDVISGYIKTQKAGINFKARCPFHNEKSPSFFISPERQIWHCFGCQKGGDMFTFVQDIEGVEFPEAMRILANKAGVKLEDFRPEQKDEKNYLYEICDLATRFFQKQLVASMTGKKALEYLKSRGLKDEIINEFRLGFAPNDWSGLSNFLLDKGFKEKDIIDAGLSLPGKEKIYDRFRSRITFPIIDLNERVVGFTARIFSADGIEPKDVGKYINTPQTQIYDKSKILYGLNRAKTETRLKNRCILVEGNMDAIMSYQAGAKNVVATSGTAMTQSHLQLLKRYTNNLDFCFDTDQAGAIATRRAIGMALSQDFNVKAIQIDDKEAKDPADYVKKHGEKWVSLAESSKSIIEFYFDKSRSETDLSSVQGKKDILLVLAPLIKRLSSSVEKSHWVSKLSMLLKTKEEAIEHDLRMVKDDLASYDENSQRGEREPRPELVPEIKVEANVDPLNPALLAVILKNPPLFKDKIAQVNVDLLDSSVGPVVQALRKEDLSNFNFSGFIKRFDGPPALQIEFSYLRGQELLYDWTDPLLMDEFDSIIRRLKKKNISSQLTSLELDIRQAEEFGQKERLPELLNSFNSLSQQLNDLQ